ncbi:hypothetical protein FB45DRAFT_937957 [Roridomyces roridus]|uniref:Uncharacterized protein n=1 Tax=Roridomyces roridus TaxID=1738132 RepID=A0AAD7FEJ9_9AGAR|nr:hypothetical protein FB45DRAFT_937957 [Roridomyces roridus]
MLPRLGRVDGFFSNEPVTRVTDGVGPPKHEGIKGRPPHDTPRGLSLHLLPLQEQVAPYRGTLFLLSSLFKGLMPYADYRHYPRGPTYVDASMPIVGIGVSVHRRHRHWSPHVDPHISSTMSSASLQDTLCRRWPHPRRVSRRPIDRASITATSDQTPLNPSPTSSPSSPSNPSYPQERLYLGQDMPSNPLRGRCTLGALPAR